MALAAHDVVEGHAGDDVAQPAFRHDVAGARYWLTARANDRRPLGGREPQVGHGQAKRELAVVQRGA